jgi:ADP-ribose pyrophosphatase
MVKVPVEQVMLTEHVYRGRVINLHVDHVRLSSGTETVREVVHHPGAVVVVAVSPDGRIVFERQYRHAAGEVLLELPAGTLRPGEDPAACAHRELAEETGYTVDQLTPLGSFFTAPGFTDEVMHAFSAGRARLATAPTPDPDEQIEVVLLTRDEAFAAVSNGTVRDAKTIAALHLATLAGWDPTGHPGHLR